MRFCSLFSGSSGNCIYLEYKDTKILIDSGVSGKKIAASLASLDVDAQKLNAILVTHEHRDHIASVGIVSRKFKAPVYANVSTWKAMEPSVGKLAEGCIQIFETGSKFAVGDIVVEPFSVSHDASDTVAYNFYCDDEKVTLMTDVGCITQNILDRISDTRYILLEANHDLEMLRSGSYPAYLKKRIMSNQGHLSNVVAGRLLAYLVKQRTEHVMLGHLSLENNTPQKAYDTVHAVLQENGIRVGKDVMLSICAREQVTSMF
jgi:phosphoribosyl 1,2-cyclic phosphodiesterase